MNNQQGRQTPQPSFLNNLLFSLSSTFILKHLLMKMIRLFVLLLFISCNNSDSTTANASNGHLYLRTYMWTGMYGTSLDISWIFLGRDGQIVRNPQHGTEPVQWEEEKKDNAKNTGTYTEKNGKLEISWADGKTSSWSIEREGSKITGIDGGIVSEPDRMPAGYRLDGQYAASTVLPNVANTQTLVLKKDGSFTMNSLGTVTTPDVASSAETNKKGNYDISGNTLTLKFDNGEVKKSVICVWDMDGQKNLVINTRYFPQEK
jgi:hypothetical protein